MAKIKIAWYCRCGAYFSGVAPESQRKHLEEAAALFRLDHDGAPHGPTDSAGTQRARKSEDRMTIRAVR